MSLRHNNECEKVNLLILYKYIFLKQGVCVLCIYLHDRVISIRRANWLANEKTSTSVRSTSVHMYVSRMQNYKRLVQAPARCNHNELQQHKQTKPKTRGSFETGTLIYAGRFEILPHIPYIQ